MTPLVAFATLGYRIMEARHLHGIRRRSTGEGKSATAVPDGWRRALLMCGVAAATLYVAMTLLVGLLWHGYSIGSQTISELSALGAPTRTLWMQLGTVYTVLMIVFGWIVWASADRNRAQQILGVLLMVHAGFGYVWPPMHQREVLAAGGGSLTDTLHIAWMMAVAVLFMGEVGFGAAALGRRFRLFSIATVAVVLACGFVTGTYTAQLQADLPTPWLGVWERISAAVYMLWITVLALALLRRGHATRSNDVSHSHRNTAEHISW